VRMHFHPYIFVEWCLMKHKYFTFVAFIFYEQHRWRGGAGVA